MVVLLFSSKNTVRTVVFLTLAWWHFFLLYLAFEDTINFGVHCTGNIYAMSYQYATFLPKRSTVMEYLRCDHMHIAQKYEHVEQITSDIRLRQCRFSRYSCIICFYSSKKILTVTFTHDVFPKINVTSQVPTNF